MGPSEAMGEQGAGIPAADARTVAAAAAADLRAEGAAETAPEAPPDRASVRRVALLAVLLVAAALGPFVQELTAQPAVRYAQTASIAERGELRLDAYRDVLGIDRVERDGHVYADKAPLQPLLAVPFHRVARAVGADPATELRIDGNLGLWWVTFWSSLVPLLVIVALGVGLLAPAGGTRRAVEVTLALCGGSLLTAYGTQLYAHVLAAALGWSAWLVVRRSDRLTVGRALASGALAGAAVTTEYPLAIVAVAVALVLVSRRAWSSLAAFVAGGLPFVVLLGWYQAVAYGSPFRVSYAGKPQHAGESLILGLPNPLQLIEILVGSRGMLIFTPVVGFAAWGLVRLARRPATDDAHLDGIVGLGVGAAFLVLQSSWQNPWGGEAPGPRYVIPALPFLIVGLAELWARAVPWVRWAAAWSVAAMLSTVLAQHLVANGSYPVVAQLGDLRAGRWVPTVWTLALGPAGWAVHLATVWGAARLLHRATAPDPAVDPAT